MKTRINNSIVNEQVVAHIVDHNRHGNEVDRVLARVGDEVDSHYPECEQLARQGVDVVALYHALENGRITGEQFGVLLSQLDVETVNVLLTNAIDFEALVQALGKGVLDFFQVASMVETLEVDDFNTGVGCMLDFANVPVECQGCRRVSVVS